MNYNGSFRRREMFTCADSFRREKGLGDCASL
jgi:hypothetical protein